MRCLALALAIVIALLHVRPARADNTAAASETARALFNEGLALHERGDLDAAIVKLRAAYALRATPVTAFELARAYVDHGDLVEARDLLLSINRMPESASRDSRASRAAVHDAATLAAGLKDRIPSLKIDLTGPGAASQPTLLIDSVEVPRAAMAEPQRLDPKRHHVVARARGAKEAAADVELREGENARLVLDLPALGAGAIGATTQPVAAEPAEPRGATTARVLVFGGAALAVVGGAVGTVMGIHAMDQVSTLKNTCTSDKVCAPSEADAIGSARTSGNVATASFIVAGAGAALAVVGLVLWPRGPASSAQASLTLAPGSLALSGQFR
jgi:hypothetical protein